MSIYHEPEDPFLYAQSRIGEKLTETEAARILELISFALMIDFNKVIDKKGRLNHEIERDSINDRLLAAALIIVGRFDLLQLLPDLDLWLPIEGTYEEYLSDSMVSQKKVYVGDYVDPFWTKLPCVLKGTYRCVLESLNFGVELDAVNAADELSDNLFKRNTKPLWIVQMLLQQKALGTAIKVAFLYDTNNPILPSHRYHAPTFSLRPGAFYDIHK